MANKLLLVLYSPILCELLMSEKNSTSISLPLSTEAIVALLDLLAKGRTFSSKDAHLLEVVMVVCFLLFSSFKVVEAGALLGLSLGKLQMGSRKVKAFKPGKPDLRNQRGPGSREEFGINSSGKEDENPKDSIKVEMLNDELGKQQQKTISCEYLPKVSVSAQLGDPNIYLSSNPCEEVAPESTRTRAKTQPLNPVCDKDFIYPNHHQKSGQYHPSELLNKENNEFQCESCQFSTPKLAFLKTHNKFMHPKTSL